MLPPRKAPKAKRETRWRSDSHRKWIRGFHCCVCGSDTNIEAAHVRIGSGAGLSQKPDDWRVVPLCGGPNSNATGGPGCHDTQHRVGERTFWADKDVEALIRAFIKASPKKAEIEQVMRERGL